MKGIVEEQKGFVLVTIVLGLALISILGLAIIGVTTSDFKMTKIDARNQSAYYIAEAGANYIIDRINEDAQQNASKYQTSAEFFQHIEKQFIRDTIVLDNFGENNGKQPKALITLSQVDIDGDTRDYKVESAGKIGDSTRTINSIISIKWSQNASGGIIDELIFYARNFTFGGSTVNAPGGSIVMDGMQTHNLNGGSSLNISNMYFNGPVKMDGGSASFGNKNNPGSIYVNGNLDFWNGTRDVYGDIRVKGRFRLKDAIVHGNAYVNGDLELGWTPQIHNNIYYTGKLVAPTSFNESLLNKCIKVDSVDKFEIPIIEYSLREDDWYVDNGYLIRGYETGSIPDRAKMLVDNYKNTNWQDIKGQVTIVSKGDIILRGGSGFTGALIAPNGKVEYSGDGTFNGVIISKNEISLPKGGNNFEFKSLSEIFDNEIPVIVNENVGDGNGAGGTIGSKDAKVTIKSNIKEE